jgi:hypothetical protein
VSVRILAALGITLAALIGEAHASSLVFPGAPSSTPSIIRLGAAKQQTADTGKAKDVVALGEAQPDVTYEKVAAIPDKPETRHGFQQSPMIIRGGIVGPAFSEPTPSAAAAKAAAPATGTAPAAGTAPATATASAAPSGDAGKKSAPPPSAPAPAAAQPVQGVGKIK